MSTPSQVVDHQTLRSIIAHFKESVTCPLCQDILKNPHSFNPGCGHFFCLGCVEARLEGPGITQSHCPVCRTPFWKKDLKPSYQLCSIVQSFSELLAFGAVRERKIAGTAAANGPDARPARAAPAGVHAASTGSGQSPSIAASNGSTHRATTTTQPMSHSLLLPTLPLNPQDTQALELPPKLEAWLADRLVDMTDTQEQGDEQQQCAMVADARELISEGGQSVEQLQGVLALLTTMAADLDAALHKQPSQQGMLPLQPQRETAADMPVAAPGQQGTASAEARAVASAQGDRAGASAQQQGAAGAPDLVPGAALAAAVAAGPEQPAVGTSPPSTSPLPARKRKAQRGRAGAKLKRRAQGGQDGEAAAQGAARGAREPSPAAGQVTPLTTPETTPEPNPADQAAQPKSSNQQAALPRSVRVSPSDINPGDEIGARSQAYAGPAKRRAGSAEPQAGPSHAFNSAAGDAGQSAGAAGAKGAAGVCEGRGEGSQDGVAGVQVGKSAGARKGQKQGRQAVAGSQQRPVCLQLIGFENAQSNRVAAYCRRLTNASALQDHTGDTTHCVVQCDDHGRAARRTLQYLCGLLHGCWVVTDRWAQDSMAAGTWLDETQYLVQGDEYSRVSAKAMGLPQLTLQGPAARQRQRIAEGRSCKLFEGVRYHLLARTVPDNSKRANIIKLLTLGGAEQISRPPQTRSPSPDTATATCPPDATGPGRLPAGHRAIPAHATARPPAAAVGDEITDADPPSVVVLVGEGLKGDEYDALVDRWGVSPTKLDWVKDSVTHFVLLPLAPYHVAKK